MFMCNLIEYSGNYSDTSGSLWQFKRNEESFSNGNPANVLQLIHHLLNINQVSQENKLLLTIIEHLKT